MTQKKDPEEALRKYIDWGSLESVLEEYAYILELNQSQKDEKLTNLTEQFNNMAEYFGAE